MSEPRQYSPDEVRKMTEKQKKAAKVSRFFSVWEVECHCGCGEARVLPKQLAAMDELREKIGVPLITRWTGGGSVCRCAAHNKKEGGATNSRHVALEACDCRAEGFTPEELAAAGLGVERFRQGGIIVYLKKPGRSHGWVHFDSGTGNNRPYRATK